MVRRADRVAVSLNSLTLRILSAVLLAPPVLAAVWYGSPYFEGMTVLAAIVMAWEWEKLVSKESFAGPGIALALASVVALILLPLPLLALVAMGVGALVASLLAPVGLRGWMAAGAPYIVLPLAALLMLRAAPEGQSILIWLFLIVWATDIGAYAAGLLIGGPKLAPSISPKKTWAGLAGGMIAAAVIAMWGGSWLGFVSPAPKLGLMGAALAVVAQGGDLFESFVKRRFDAKDSSQLIPGHGGLLDRIDGLLAAGFALGLLYLATFDGGFEW